MFEFVRRHTRILQFVLVLLIFPSFVFFGIQGYSRLSSSENHAVARVGGRKITQAELDLAHRQRIESFRRQMPNIDPKMLDTPQMKRATLETMVREQVMLSAAERSGFATSDERLERIYRSDPQFAPFRNPDGSLNIKTLEPVLQSQGLSLQGFDQRMRQEVEVRQVQLGLAGTAIAPATSASQAMDAMYQQREVQIQRFDAQAYLAKVNPSAADIEAYYKNPVHAAEFQTQEKADIEYVVLDADAINKSIKVSEEELRKYYSENEKNFIVPEERRAAHILMKDKAKAEALLADLQKNPAFFSDAARKNSQDVGSASKGGDLDLFLARGDTDKAYGDALFALKKPGELSPVVQTPEGFFILQLKAVRGGEKRSFDSVRVELEQERKKQMAQAEYAKATTDFSNMAYEQPDSLKPLADKFKLEVQGAKSVTRAPAPGASGPLASQKLLEAVFAPDAIRNKRNTEAVETAPSTLVSARVVRHIPAATQPLAEVSARVREKVAAVQAAALAKTEGEARLAELRKAPATDLASPALLISRAAELKDVPPAVVAAVMRSSVAQLPVYAGVDLPGQGYVIAKIVKVLGRDPSMADPARGLSQYTQGWSTAEGQAYYTALKSRFKVEVQPRTSSETTASNN